MKVLLLGRKGQLGWELQRALDPVVEITALDYEDVDLADRYALSKYLRESRSEVIINAAAYTDVDGAESNREKAFAVNSTAPRIMAEHAKAAGTLLIHYSTDYVFDGSKDAPYSEEDTPHPLNTYGQSKLQGEQAIQSTGGAFLILRTAWLYSLRGNSFVNKVLSWGRQQEVLRIVDDQISNPTWARTLAQLTAEALNRGSEYVRSRRGVYHLAGGGFASRYDWAKEILKLDPRAGEQRVKEVQRAATSEYPTPARRPLFSALDCRRWKDAFGLEVPLWADELKTALTTTSSEAVGT